MNNRRQTIWLVSMLSLMVILSAYYLFTEDVTPATQTADKAGGYQATGSAGTSKTNAEGVQVTEVDGASGADVGTDANSSQAGTDKDASATSDNAATADQGAQTDDGKAAGEATDKTSAEATGGNTDKNAQPSDGQATSGGQDDQAVLEQMNNLTGRAYFDDIQLKRQEQFDREEERLNAIVADTSKHTRDETEAASADLSRLEATEERISSLEEKLLSEYENAVVEQEDNSNFKVVVQADKLDKTQAVSIVETATKELGVAPDRVTVQYIANP
ncbi:SpoIIIAH-like family protein [Cohnella thermotolerans]|uniref:SpoIIIAH-like family protein n=1 Tax=Cohnella thermotolerans TaxID=329858 RepID=UPI000411DFF8|nr:SpoIIIAH-like family protein [Cohnella thermotolerans]